MRSAPLKSSRRGMSETNFAKSASSRRFARFGVRLLVFRGIVVESLARFPLTPKKIRIAILPSSTDCRNIGNGDVYPV